MKRHLLPAVMVWAAVGAPLHGVNKYVAIGDSITAGSSWPVSCGICPAIFDCIGSCDDTPQTARDQCGFVGRLDSWLGGGSSNYVKNRGWGAEQTDEAATRFPGEMDTECPGSPGDCISIILMHGTNDMSHAVSPESARANLELIIDEAKSRNIDVLLMTIIRRGGDPGHSLTEDYKDEILSLAASESLPSVNPWQTLCPSTSCFEDNYWWPGEGPCFDPDATELPGHLDPDGYDELTDLIKAVFPGAAPPAPVPTAPTGDITDTQPAFTWPDNLQARWWELEVDAVTTWWEAAAHCTPGGSCTVDPGVALIEGSHSWRVRGRNLRGLGVWSAVSAFEIWALPGTVTPSAPAGLVIDADPMSAPFEWEPYVWSEATAATDYDLVVSGGGGPVVVQSFDSSICIASVCSAHPAAGLDAGGYSWTVQTRNPAASGPLSAVLEFEVRDTAPGEATPFAPTGDRFAPFTPLYQWLPAPGATEYDLEVKDMAGNVDYSAAGLLASVACDNGFCSHTGGSLADLDGYTLRVLGRNSIGEGLLSSVGADFTVIACVEPSSADLAALAPPPVTTTESVSHCGPVSAAEAGSYTIEASGALTLHTRDGFIVHDQFVVWGELTVRSP